MNMYKICSLFETVTLPNSDFSVIIVDFIKLHRNAKMSTSKFIKSLI